MFSGDDFLKAFFGILGGRGRGILAAGGRLECGCGRGGGGGSLELASLTFGFFSETITVRFV